MKIVASNLGIQVKKIFYGVPVHSGWASNNWFISEVHITF